MPEVLDQREVDALLASVGSGAGAAPPAHTAPGLVFSRSRPGSDGVDIKAYDFKRPERVSNDQMRALQTLHEAFARNFGASLSGFMRTIVEIKVATCEQMTYSEFTSGLPNPTSFSLVEGDGLEGQMCLEVSPLIIYPLIDRLLGGNSQDLFIPQRPMTLIETRLIGNVTKRALAALAEAWAGLRQLQFRVTTTESNPQLVQIVPPNEVVVVIGFELRMGSRAGTMNLCIPFNVIEPFMEHLSSQSWFASAKNQASREHESHLEQQLSRAPLHVTGLLAETTITIAELLGLRVGDVITTAHSAGSPIALCVEGEKKYLASVGQHRGMRALRVSRAVAPGDRV